MINEESFSEFRSNIDISLEHQIVVTLFSIISIGREAEFSVFFQPQSKCSVSWLGSVLGLSFFVLVESINQSVTSEIVFSGPFSPSVDCVFLQVFVVGDFSQHWLSGVIVNFDQSVLSHSEGNSSSLSVQTIIIEFRGDKSDF